MNQNYYLPNNIFGDNDWDFKSWALKNKELILSNSQKKNNYSDNVNDKKNVSFCDTNHYPLETSTRSNLHRQFQDEKFSGVTIQSVLSSIIDPISNKIMKEPVRASDGCFYDRNEFTKYCFEKRFSKNGIVSPVTGKLLINTRYQPDYNRKQLIVQLEKYLKKCDLNI